MDRRRFWKVSSRGKWLDYVDLWEILTNIRLFNTWWYWWVNTTSAVRERLDKYLTWKFIILFHYRSKVIISLFAYKFPYICYGIWESGIFQIWEDFGSSFHTPEISFGYPEEKLTGEDNSELKEYSILCNQGSFEGLAIEQ